MNQVPPKLAVPLGPLVPRLELDGDGEKAIAGADLRPRASIAWSPRAAIRMR